MPDPISLRVCPEDGCGARVTVVSGATFSSFEACPVHGPVEPVMVEYVPRPDASADDGMKESFHPDASAYTGKTWTIDVCSLCGSDEIADATENDALCGECGEWMNTDRVEVVPREALEAFRRAHDLSEAFDPLTILQLDHARREAEHERDEMRHANIIEEDTGRPLGQSVEFWQDRCLDHATALDAARIRLHEAERAIATTREALRDLLRVLERFDNAPVSATNAIDRARAALSETVQPDNERSEG